MIYCENVSDFMYPMLADVYYPVINQGSYGEIKKEWGFDRTIVCNAEGIGGAGKEEIRPEVFTQHENKLVARSKTDVRISSASTRQSNTNILITNIRSSAGELLYKETSGPRAGLGSVYEIATLEPFVGPFGSIEYYKMVWRKTENQVVDEQ
jgi:hypothetical protein